MTNIIINGVTMNKPNFKLNTRCIENYIKFHKITKKEFCAKCDISLYMFNKIMNGYLGFKATILKRIAILLNTSCEYLMIEL